MYNWKEADKLLGKRTDREIADEYDIPRQLVANRRIMKRIPVLRDWSRFEHLLGTMGDTKLAGLLGKTRNTVTTKRIRNGIPAFRFAGRERELEDEFCETLSESYERQVRTKSGIIDILTSTSLYECKSTLSTEAAHRAIGQLLCYGTIYPDKKRFIVCRKTRTSPEIINVIEELGIEIIVLPMI